jgi:hypothetical protein
MFFTDRQRLLVILLRLAGVVTLSAFLAMFLPAAWMASTHQWLGLGEFPHSPVVDYLARSVAALYGFHGVLLFIIARDPQRFRTIVQYVGVMNVALGLIMVAIDAHAGLPWWWTLGEGPPIVAFGAVILLLSRPTAIRR